MKVTKVSVQKEEKENSRVKGYAIIELDGVLKINGIRIIEGNSRMFAAMPNRKISDDKYIDYVYPVNKELREEIEEYVDSLVIKNHIIFAGTTSEVYKYYSAFDLFVLPSLHEGLPVVAIEAQATGLPVIMADTITQEAKITTNVSYLPLSDMDLWVSRINQYKNIERKDTKEEITASGFDIKASASNLIKFYQNM